MLNETGKKVATLRAQVAPAPPPFDSGDSLRTPVPAPLAPAVAEVLRQLDSVNASQRLWEKDYTFWKADPAIGAKIQDRLGWLNVIATIENDLPDLRDFVDRVRMEEFSHVVLLGMGGSSLCPEVLRVTFGARDGYPRLHVLDSTDPATVQATERAIDMRRTLFLVASKSGSTLETLSHFHYFHEVVKGLVGEEEAARHFVAITDPGSGLDSLDFPFRHVFLNPRDIGGRYSALSYFGMVPAALAGIDLNRLLDAAVRMATACGPGVAAQANPGMVLGAIMGAGANAGRDKMTIVASPPIASVGLWIEQLIAESTGKEGKGILPVAAEPLGAPAVYGNDRVFAYLRTDDGFDPAQDAAIAALEAAGQPVVRLRVHTPFDLAAEFFRWEVATAIAGHVLGINPFDEPNVQESKDNTKRILGVFEGEKRFTPIAPLLTEGQLRVGAAGASQDALRGLASVPGLRATLARMARAGDYIAIMAYIEPVPEHDALLARLRTELRDASPNHVATTAGYGPRFLHSTGQLHKGGPNTGIFLQIVATTQEDIAIPNEPFTFGNLIWAQALGDYESLQAHGRRVVRVELGADIRHGLTRLTE